VGGWKHGNPEEVRGHRWR